MERVKKELYGTLDEVVNKLQEAKKNGEHIYCEFNGKELDSDTVTMDSAYIAVCGAPRDEYLDAIDRERQPFLDEMAEKKHEAELKKPLWIDMGKDLIYPERYDDWEECVDARARDIYVGEDLEAALSIMRALDRDDDMEKAKTIYRNRPLVDRAKALVRDMVFDFSSKGPEFCEEVIPDLTPEEIIKIEDKKEENKKLAEIHKDSKSI